MKSHKHILSLFFFLILSFYSNTLLFSQNQEEPQVIPHNEDYVSIPSAVPVVTPEEALFANYEALKVANAKSREEAISTENTKEKAALEKEDWLRLDFIKEAIILLVFLIPFSILLHFAIRKRIHFPAIRKSFCATKDVRFSYWPLLLLIPIILIQVITTYVNNSENKYDSILFEHKKVPYDALWSAEGNRLSKVTVKTGYITDPVVIVNGVSFQEIPLSELKKIIQKDERPLCFSMINRYIVLPSAYTDEEIHVYSPRRIFSIIDYFSNPQKSIWAGVLVYVFWLFVQIYLNNGLNCIYHKKFRTRVFLVGLISISIVIAGAFWMSHIPLTISQDGRGYIDLACTNTIKVALFSERTPGYPLFLSVIDYFSPLSFHSVIYFQILVYLFSLSVLLYQFYKKGVPMILLWFIYFLFYNYFSEFFFRVMCEILEISGLAATAAIGLVLSNCIIKKKKALFICYLILAVLLVFYSVMVKPFPGIILFPGCIMFFTLLGTVKFSKAFLLTALVGILCVILPATYCTIRWKLCGDWNFCSIVNRIRGGYELTLSTENSLNAEHVTPEQRLLAKEIIQCFEDNRPDLKLKWPWCNEKTSLLEFHRIRMRLIYEGGFNIYFHQKEWSELSNEQRLHYVTPWVYSNERCRELFNLADPQLKRNIMQYYCEAFYEYITTTPRYFSKTFGKFNPYQSASYFILTVLLPLIIFLLITFVPACHRFRFGSWKIPIMLIVFSSVPLFTYFGQLLYMNLYVFEARSETVMLFCTMLGTILLSLYCIYSCIISLILALRQLYLRFAPKQIMQT